MRSCLLLSLAAAASCALAASIPRYEHAHDRVPHRAQPSAWPPSILHSGSGSSSSSGASTGSSSAAGDLTLNPLPPLDPIKLDPLPPTNAERLRRGLPLKQPATATRTRKARQAEVSISLLSSNTAPATSGAGGDGGLGGETLPELKHADDLVKIEQIGEELKKLLGKRDELPLMPTEEKRQGYVALSVWPDDKTAGYLSCTSEKCEVAPPTAVSRATVFSFSPTTSGTGLELSFEDGGEGHVLAGVLEGEDTTNIPLKPLSSSSTEDSTTAQSHIFSYSPSTNTLTSSWSGKELALVPSSPTSSPSGSSSSSRPGLVFTTDIEAAREARYQKTSSASSLLSGLGKGPLTMRFVRLVREEW